MPGLGDGNVLAGIWKARQMTAEASGRSLSTFWGHCWRALQLATEALHVVREQILEDSRRADSASAWQCSGGGVCRPCYQTGVAHQLLLAGTRLINQENVSPQQTKLVKNLSRLLLHRDLLSSLGGPPVVGPH